LSGGSALRFGLRFGFRRRGCYRLCRFLLNIYFAFEVGAFFNGDALGENVSGDNRRLAQLGSLGGANISVQLTLDYDTLGVKAAFHLAVRANHQIIVA